MRILTAVLLLTSSFALAQESPIKGPATKDPNANSSTPRSYQGCVIRSGGGVMLADPSNKDYKLVSSSGRSLDSYVGQEVTITAVDVDPRDTSVDERSDPQAPKQPPTLSVQDITEVSDHCNSPK